MNTASQYIVLTLKTGVVYSFRVRGADSAGRGERSKFGPILYFLSLTMHKGVTHGAIGNCITIS